MALNLTLHGAGRTVAGSTLEFSHGATRILVDHGMFQGSRSLEELNRASMLDDPGAIAAVILTHAHIDHCVGLHEWFEPAPEGLQGLDHVICDRP